MKRKLTLLSICLTMSVHNAVFAQLAPTFPKGKITVRTLDESGQPMPNANAEIAFSINTYTNPIVENVKKITSADGTASGEGKCDSDVSYAVQKDGFYKFRGRYEFIHSPNGLPASSDGTWQPWNPTFTATLKRIVKPVPLYAKKLFAEIPTDAYPVGFDLVESDWVVPYGKGKVADFIFRVDRVIASEREYSAKLQLTFSNAGDGIVAVPIRPEDINDGSELKLPQQAPATGYEPAREWQQYTRKRPNFGGTELIGGARGDVGYFFRVRTVKDSQGNIIQAMYGKIQPDISLSPGLLRTARGGVGFTYYLNPTGERGLEFDVRQNLFRNLSVAEEVREP